MVAQRGIPGTVNEQLILCASGLALDDYKFLGILSIDPFMQCTYIYHLPIVCAIELWSLGFETFRHKISIQLFLHAPIVPYATT